MADFASQIKDLQADFQRIADRAPWVRAAFGIKTVRFTFFILGHPADDGPNAALVTSVKSQESAIISELYALTEQAGALVVEIIQSGQYLGKPVGPKPADYDVITLSHAWLFYLLHYPPMMFECWVKGPDGRKHLRPLQPTEIELPIWIDNYPQVCVSALAWLKTNSSAVPGTTQAPSTRAPASVPDSPPTDVKVNGPHDDGAEGGRWVWWKNKRYNVPKGTVYRLLDYMWNRNSASYGALNDSNVFESAVAPQTVRSYVNKANTALPTGFPWRLSADSVNRQLTKISRTEGM